MTYDRLSACVGDSDGGCEGDVQIWQERGKIVELEFSTFVQEFICSNDYYYFSREMGTAIFSPLLSQFNMQ